MYKINKNIYFVTGAYNACIYNLNTKKLLTVKHDDIEKVQMAFLNPNNRNQTTELLKHESIIVKSAEYELTDFINLDENRISIAWLEINTDCNFNCIHCYVNTGETREVTRMSLRDFKIAIDRLKAFGINRIHIIGGEPLVHPDFREMMEYALPKFDFTVLFTNGFLLTWDYVLFLKNLGLTEIDISLYSTKKSEHERVTQMRGSFEKTLTAIHMVEESGIICHIATIRVPGIDLGLPYESTHPNAAVQHFDYMRATGKGATYWHNINYLDNKKAITKTIMQRIIDPQKVLFKMKFHNCFGRYIRIDPLLNVYPCTMENRFLHGNVRMNELKDIINNEICVFNKDKVKNCCICEFRYVCSDCRPDTDNDDITSKPWFCTYNPLNGTWRDNYE